MMSNNKRSRKFEGTCYIPGEQLVMMAKYYRGANLNLNLTLVEDDMGIMKDSLDNSCWCSKLDEVDKMKLQHMKGDAWKINHDHHVERSLGSGNCCFSPVNGTSKAVPETKCDKGIDTYSLYNLPPRRENYDSRYDVWKGPPSMRSNYYGNRNHQRYEGPRRGFITSQDADYQSPNTHAYPVTHSQSRDSENRYRRGLDPEIEDEMTSLWLSEKSEDIKCAVCKRDVCAICKNPLRGRPCHCKCVIPNAGLCNECDAQCDQEIDKEECVSRAQEPNQTNLCNLMLMLMSSQMFNRPQNTELPCRCNARNSKPVSVCDSDSSSGSTSCTCCTEKVQKIFLYNCANNEKNKKNSREDSSDSSRNCDCCKCAKKGKKRESRDRRNESPNSERKKYSTESKNSENSMHSELSTNTKSAKRSMESKRSALSPNKPVKGSLTSDHPSEKVTKRGTGHSWFRQPLGDSVYQSSAGKKGIQNNNKRKRMEDHKGSDNESQSSHQSDKSTVDRKKTSRSSSVELKDFLLCLPKIKSDLATLLTKIKGEDRKTTTQQKVSSFPVQPPYFSNVRMRSTIPFTTHPAANTPLPSSRPRQHTGHSFQFSPNSSFHPYLEGGIGRNQNLLSDPWDESNRFNQGVPHLRVNNSGYPMEQQYRCAFPNLPSNEISFGTPVKPQSRPTFTQGGSGFDYRFSLSGQKPNIRQSYTDNKLRPPYKHPIFEKNGVNHGFQPPNSLWTCYQRNNTQTPIEETRHLVDQNFENQQNTTVENEKSRYNDKNRTVFREQQLLDPQSLILKDILIVGEPVDGNSNAFNSTNKKGVKLPNSQVAVKLEGSNQVDRTVRTHSGDFMSNDSDETKEFPQNEQMHSIQSVDSKHTTDQFMSAVEVNEQLSEDIFHQEGGKKTCEEQDQQTNEKRLINNQSIGPGQFRVATFNAPWFRLPSGPTEKINRIFHPENERDMKVLECHDLRDTAFPGSSSVLKEGAQFHSTTDHITSTPSISDNSRNLQPNHARLSAPSSEEDLTLPQLPSESKEYLSTNKGTLRYNKCGLLNKYTPRVFEVYDSGSCDNRVHVENELFGHHPKLTGNDVAVTDTEQFQAAKFQFAQEVIQSMVQNVHEVLASIESDSESRICHKNQERQSFFMHLGNDGRMNEESERDAVSKTRNSNCNISANQPSTSVTGHDEYISGFTENHVGFSQVHQSFSSNQFCGRGCSSETPSSLNAVFQEISRERNFFVLDSDRSNSSVFTERLRQSLANETPSPNNSAILTAEEHTRRGHCNRGCSPKPLKRRSWIPPPK